MIISGIKLLTIPIRKLTQGKMEACYQNEKGKSEMWSKVPWALWTPAPNRPAELHRARAPHATEEESKGTAPPGSYLGTNNLTIDVTGQEVPLCSGRLLKGTMYILGAHWSLHYSPDPTKTRKEGEEEKKGRGEKNFIVTTFFSKEVNRPP